MPNKRHTPPDLEISWRTRELGPEMRRRLFEKVIPSTRAAAARDGPATVPPGKDPKHIERPKGPKQSPK